jgi:hypothetical protein
MAKTVDKAFQRLTRGSRPARGRDGGPGHYKKGHKKTGGRKKGVPNVLTRDVRQAIIDGLTEFGGPEGLKGFVKKVANENISTAAMLLRAVLPIDTKVNVTKEVNFVYPSFADLQREAELLGLPAETILELKDYRRLPTPAAELEGEANEIDGKADKKR